MGKLLVQLHEELVDSLRTGYVKYWKGRWFNVKMAEKEDRSSFYAKVGKHQPWIFSSLFLFFSLPLLDGKKEFQSLYTNIDDDGYG